MKRLSKKTIFAFILGICISFTFGVTATVLYSASEIGFNPTDSNWDVKTVEDAINDLYTNSSGKYKKSIKPMASDTSTDGSASSNSVYPSSACYRAFDGNTNNASDSATYHAADYVFPSTTGIYLRYEFNTSRKINYAIWYGRGISYQQQYYQTPSEYKFQASNDGSEWVDLTELLTNNVNDKGVSQKVEFTKNVGTYKYYQMIIYKSNDNSYGSVAIDELEYYEK